MAAFWTPSPTKAVLGLPRNQLEIKSRVIHLTLLLYSTKTTFYGKLAEISSLVHHKNRTFYIRVPNIPRKSILKLHSGRCSGLCETWILQYLYVSNLLAVNHRLKTLFKSTQTLLASLSTTLSNGSWIIQRM